MTAPAAPLAPLRATKPAAPGPLEQLPMGVTLYADGTASFRVWAPHAQAVALEVRASGSGDANAAAVATTSYGLARIGDTWAALLPAGALRGGTAYQVLITAGDGSQLLRRDPYARHTDFDSSWCFVDDATQYNWSEASDRWTPPDFDTYIIYEMHVGSFTPEGTFAAAAARLAHVASLGFTAVQLMPIAEHSDRWCAVTRAACVFVVE